MSSVLEMLAQLAGRPQPQPQAQPAQEGQAEGEAGNAAAAVANPKKRKRKPKTVPRVKKPPKQYIAPIQMPKKQSGYLYTFGTNSKGQLGHSKEFEEFPTPVGALQKIKIKQIACGGQHTLVLDKSGQVWSFGSNEKKALGRKTKSSEEERTPTIVSFPKKVKMISAGDGHSAALTEDGEVYAWGCYIGKGGVNYAIDAYRPCEKDAEFCENPYFITEHFKKDYEDARVIKIVSGANHIVMLGDDSRLYTCGDWEHGQLGRDQSLAPRRKTRTDPGYKLPDKEFNLRPEQCMVGHKYNVRNIWASRLATFCFAGEAGQIYACGNNLYSQLGMQVVRWDIRTKNVFHPTKNISFNKGEPGNHRWKQIVGGDHHTIGLTEDGKVYSIGRPADGRLGLGMVFDFTDDVGAELKPIPGLSNKICVQIAAGNDTGYALTIEGELYCWGAASRRQLPLGDDLSRDMPTLCKKLKDRLGDLREISRISVGSEHVCLVIADKSKSVEK